MSANLPTSPAAVEAWLRSFADDKRTEEGGTYPFLFGMALVKLAEAHAENERLRARIVRMVEEGHTR